VELCTAWTPSVVPGHTNVTVNHGLTLNQNLTIGTGNYIFNQDVTDQPDAPNYNFIGNTAGGSPINTAGTTTFGSV
jgi:hypothetical protein